MSRFDRFTRKKPKTSEASELAKLLDVIEQVKEGKAYEKAIEPTPRKREWEVTKQKAPVWIEGSRWQIGDKIWNRWEILDIKVGGMGFVYIVHEPELNELYAVKTYQDQFLWDEDVINRFMKEAKTWVNLEKHTNIVFANIVTRIEGKPLIFLEYIDGGDLERWIGRIDIPQALNFAIQFCTGMNYAYKKLGVIHRDIKPGNVMITKDKVAKVTDFGLVSALKERTEKLDLIQREAPSVSRGWGTLYYMPPEQFSEDVQRHFSFKPKPITTRTDIYSFGMTFYYLLTGRLPTYAFEDNDYQIMRKIFKESQINPKYINPEIPERLDRLIMKCLEKNPRDRYKNFEEVRSELIQTYNNLTGEKYVIKGRKEDLTSGHWVAKGLSLFFLDKFDQAIECFDKALEKELRYAVAWSSKGIALTKQGRHEEAIECFDKAIEIDQRDAKTWTDKGNALYYLHRYKEAIKCSNKALAINPALANAWNLKGTAVGLLGRYEEAIKCFDKAIEIDPRDADAWYNKGNALLRQEKHGQAMECFDKVITIDPRHALSWYHKGGILFRLTKYEDALECADRALKIDPTLEPARELKELCLGDIERLGKHEEAVEYYDKVIRINPELAEAWDGKGLALGNLGRYEEAIACHDKALELNPGLADAWSNKGAALASLGRYEEAIESYDRAIKINPKLAASWGRKGLALGCLGRYEDALECVNGALKIDPTLKPAKKVKGICLEKLRDKNDRRTRNSGSQ